MAVVEHFGGSESFEGKPRTIPITMAVSSFSAFGFAALLAALNELSRQSPLHHDVGHNLGFVAATVFGVAALALLRRSVHNEPTLRLAALSLVGPAAVWSVLSVALDGGVPRPVHLLFAVVSGIGAAVLLVDAVDGRRWAHGFVGLGLLGLAASVVVVMTIPPGTHLPLFLSLTLVISSSACLYGALVDVELAAIRSARALREVHQRLELTERETQDLLHDLRNGLLSVEAASILASGDTSGLLRAEIARLRILATRGPDQPVAFDVVAPLRNLSEVRRASGVVIDVRAPEVATVTGSCSQVMSILQNLIDNAQRHGEGEIRISVEERGGALVVAVADQGAAIAEADVERLFERGSTTHPAGSGIGLDAAQRLARANNAGLTFERTPEGTTSFVLSFESHGAGTPR